jgi:hypothetical protein
MNIPQKGTVYKYLTIDADLADQSQLYIQIKNYEKGTITKDLGAIKADNVSKKIALPENISEVEGLQVTLWEKSNPIVIRKMAIEYWNVDMEIPVSGKIANWSATETQYAAVFQDINESKTLDPKIDKPWLCRANFPGAGAVEVDVSGSFVIKRDDKCYTDVKPDKWYTDDQKNSLPNGNWLLVVGGEQKVYPFEVKKNQTESVLDLK